MQQDLDFTKRHCEEGEVFPVSKKRRHDGRENPKYTLAEYCFLLLKDQYYKVRFSSLRVSNVVCKLANLFLAYKGELKNYG